MICYIKGDDFTNELIESLRLAKMAEFRKKYRHADVLLVDDIQFIGGKESTQEEFFHTFNALHEAHKQIVLTSDRPPKEIRFLDDRLRSRFEQDLIATFSRLISRAESHHQAQRQSCDLNIFNEIREYIANKLKSNVRQLEGNSQETKGEVLP